MNNKFGVNLIFFVVALFVLVYQRYGNVNSDVEKTVNDFNVAISDNISKLIVYRGDYIGGNSFVISNKEAISKFKEIIDARKVISLGKVNTYNKLSLYIPEYHIVFRVRDCEKYEEAIGSIGFYNVKNSTYYHSCHFFSNGLKSWIKINVLRDKPVW
ncbi:MAG: hypothetical protein HQL32_11425 [Planctomycetes bacterium]|nr:hypothetical protein [Planctomycetota bacterium]